MLFRPRCVWPITQKIRMALNERAQTVYNDTMCNPQNNLIQRDDWSAKDDYGSESNLPGRRRRQLRVVQSLCKASCPNSRVLDLKTCTCKDARALCTVDRHVQDASVLR
jgi:hypothetical protein